MCRKIKRSDIPYKDQYAEFIHHRALQTMECMAKIKDGRPMDEEAKSLNVKLIQLSILRDEFKRLWEKYHKDCKKIKKELEGMK
jgi:hypothetical protein